MRIKDKHMSEKMKTTWHPRPFFFGSDPFFFASFYFFTLTGRMNKKDRKKAKSLEIMLYDQARKIYDCELMVIGLDDHCVELAPKKAK
jgi:hypothetical protein